MSDSALENVIEQLEKVTPKERKIIGKYLKKFSPNLDRLDSFRLKFREVSPEQLQTVRKFIRTLETLTPSQRKFIAHTVEKLAFQNHRFSVFVDRLKSVHINRREVVKLANDRGASKVEIFQTHKEIENDNTENDEVNFLVNLSETRSLLDLGGLLMDLRELLGLDVFVFTEKTIKDIYLDRVLQEALPLGEPSENDYRIFYKPFKR